MVGFTVKNCIYKKKKSRRKFIYLRTSIKQKFPNFHYNSTPLHCRDKYHSFPSMYQHVTYIKLLELQTIFIHADTTIFNPSYCNYFGVGGRLREDILIALPVSAGTCTRPVKSLDMPPHLMFFFFLIS